MFTYKKSALKVVKDMNGNAYMIDEDFQIYIYNGNEWINMYIKAKDLAAASEVWYIDFFS